MDFFLKRYFVLFGLLIISYPFSLKSQTLIQIGKALEEQKLYDSAIAYFSKAIDTKNTDKAYLYRAGVYYKIKLWPKAIIDYETANTISKSSGDYGLALCYARLRDTANAIKFLESHLKSKYKKSASEIRLERAFAPYENTEIWRNLWKKQWYTKYNEQVGEANYLLDAGDWMGVINYTADLLSNKEKKHELLFIRGTALMKQGNLKTALSDLDNAIDINKRNYEYFEIRGDIYIQLQKYTEALVDYNLAIDLAPEEFRLYQKRIECHLKGGNAENASEDISLLNNLFKSKKEVQLLTSKWAYFSGRYVQALDNLNKLVTDTNNVNETILWRARVYDKTQLNDNALKDYNAYLKAFPENTEALQDRGMLYLKINQTKKGCADLKKAESLGNIQAGRLLWQNCK